MADIIVQPKRFNGTDNDNLIMNTSLNLKDNNNNNVRIRPIKDLTSQSIGTTFLEEKTLIRKNSQDYNQLGNERTFTFNLSDLGLTGNLIDYSGSILEIGIIIENSSTINHWIIPMYFKYKIQGDSSAIRYSFPISIPISFDAFISFAISTSYSLNKIYVNFELNKRDSSVVVSENYNVGISEIFLIN